MKNTSKSIRKRLQRSNSVKKRRFSPMLADTEAHRNPRNVFKGNNQSGYRVRIQSANKKNNQNNIKNEYAIAESDERVQSRERSRKLSKELKFKEIERKHRNKLEKDIELQRNQLRKRRSQGSLGSVTNSSAASLHNYSNTVSRKDSQSTRKIERKNYVIMAIQPQRYIKMSPDHRPEKQINQLSNEQHQVRLLVEEIQQYKKKYEKALKAVEKLSKAMQGQNNRHFLQKQIYEQKIRMLKTQLESKNLHKNSGALGHIYYYKQFPQHNILPESFIMQQREQSNESVANDETTINKDSIARAEKLVEQYVNMPENSSGIKSNLSIQSK